MPVELSLDFGYLPHEMNFVSEDILIATLPRLSDKLIKDDHSLVDRNWIYAPSAVWISPGGQIIAKPYSRRVFSLPKTHCIRHRNADGEEHVRFLIWCLSYFVGMRLTVDEAGFLDSTPNRIGALVDFSCSESDICRLMQYAEDFWRNSHTRQGSDAKILSAVINALFISQNPQYLQFEEFQILYSALDACYALAKSGFGVVAERHSDRITRTCERFGISPPGWVKRVSPSDMSAVDRRNCLVHEAIFGGEPLGFALNCDPQGRSIELEMQALICRIVMAMITAKSGPSYIYSGVDTRQIYGLGLK